MVQLTSGFVAGIIAAVVLIARLSAPTVLTFILAGFIREQETAATWTAVAGPIQASFWPTILRADSTITRDVPRRINFTTLAIPFLATLIAIASVVTPLGLYEADVLDTEPTHLAFKYVPDSGTAVMATSPRNGRPFTRQCFYESCVLPCPYATGEVEIRMEEQECEVLEPIDLNVSDVLRDRFSSGSKGRSTVAGFFDIEWRQITSLHTTKTGYGEPSRHPAGAFRYLDSYIQEPASHVIEGIIVDTQHRPSVGFRNHTVPETAAPAYWAEEILFIEPETVCVEHNMSIDFRLTTVSEFEDELSIANLTLVDRGGFVNFNKTSPINDRNDRDPGNNIPDLRRRAAFSAWSQNALSMAILNVTNVGGLGRNPDLESYRYIKSEMNKEFALPNSSSTFMDISEFAFLGSSKHVSGYFGELVDMSRDDDLGNRTQNPFGVALEDFTYAINECEGWFHYPLTTLNNTYVSCSTIRGAPQRMNPGSSTVLDDASSWSSPLYSCASAIRATIKTVHFSHNGSAVNADNLVIEKIVEKDYASEEDMPLWGVEDTSMNGNSKNNFTLREMNAIWGLIDESSEKDNMTTVRQPWLYLLSANLGIIDIGIQANRFRDNLAAGIAPLEAMNTVSGADTFTNPAEIPGDPLGINSLSRWVKWQTLSKNASSAAEIVKLLWVDFAASAMVGTKGAHDYNNGADRAVFLTRRKVRYHWKYGIPAFFSVFCLGLVGVVLLWRVIRRKAGLGIMRRALKYTSLGRVATSMSNWEEDRGLLNQPPKEWNRSHGGKVVDLGKRVEDRP